MSKAGKNTVATMAVEDTDWQVGVDVGGTFTDVIAANTRTGEFHVAKTPSIPGNQWQGVLNGLQKLQLNLAKVAGFVHGTTVGTNAVLERKGVLCGIITTAGFRDLLELGRRTRPNLYGMTGSFEALIPREYRMEVPERIAASGDVVVPLDEDAVRKAALALAEKGAEAIVIHFLHSYANPNHELRAAEIVRSVWPNKYVTVGHEILSEMREFERGSTATVNAYIQPLMTRYLSKLSDQLAKAGLARQLLIMQGNAGTMTAKLASEHAAQTVMSGPAAGVLAAARISREAGFENVIACDMGGTSFDVTLIKNGQPALSSEKDVTYSVPVRVPMIDVHTIGAGGGSIARIDAANLLQIGPDSAGSWPGPICYGRGGKLPTVTDANLVLGRLDPNAMPEVATPVTVEEVGEVIREKIGVPLGLDTHAAAQAIIAVTTSHLAGAIRLVSVERGEDPRDYAIFAFGGAGALHAVALAKELGIPKVIVPRWPGATSALGCMLADLRHDFVRTIRKPLADCNGEDMDAIFAAQAEEGRRLIEADDVKIEGITAYHEADLLFRGQTHIFRIPVSSPGFDPKRVLESFHAFYEARFNIELQEMTALLVNLRTTVIGTRPLISLADAKLAEGEKKDVRWRSVWFGSQPWDTPIIRRESLAIGATLQGPAIIEQMDATTVLEPGAKLVVDPSGTLIISIEGGA